MSLLTEEQVKELANLHIVWRDDRTHEFSYFHYLKEWNDKQTGIQVKVNWELAPKEATSADIKLQWRGIEQSWAFEAVFANIPRPITPHPHAEIIAKYAEVAARRCDPWVEFELFDRINDTWANCKCAMAFDPMKTYRHIGDKSDPMTARKGDD